MILVTGATGNVGRNVVAQLTAEGHRVRALTRRPDAAGLPGDVDVVAGDLTDPSSFDAALTDVERVFLFPIFGPGALVPFTRAAKAAGVEHVVMLSSAAIDLPDAGMIGQAHSECETAVDEAGLPWTFVRPGVFMANDLSWAPQVRAGGPVRLPYPMASSAPVDERDIAAVAVTALLARHAGCTYTLTGPESLTQSARVGILGDIVGRPLTVEEISREEAREQLLHNMPDFAADLFLDSLAGADGAEAPTNSTVAEVAGRPAYTYREWAAHHSADLHPGPLTASTTA